MKKIQGFASIITTVSVVISLSTVTVRAGALGANVTPIAIDGVVRDKGLPVVGKVVVAWCGDISHFGGSDTTDLKGHFAIHTNSDDCPLGWQMSVVAYNEVDPSLVDGLGLAIVHGQTTADITIGDFSPVTVPEYSWASGSLSLLAAGGAMFAMRRYNTRHFGGYNKV